MKIISVSTQVPILRSLFAVGFIIAFAGCNFPVRTASPGIRISGTASLQVDDLPPVGYSEDTDTAAASDINGTVAPMQILTETATIAHIATPGEPGAVSSYVEDYSSKSAAAEKRAPGGDSFTYNLFERPFLAEDMIYLPGVDIVRADLARDVTWFYVTIRLQEAPAEDARYAVEVDADIDGRGDFLIGTAAPAGTDWTTNGVQIWEDSNGDVGGPIPVKSDPPDARDGYDELTFEQGIGDDPDRAWARLSPSDPKQVQIAFKRAAIGSDAEFLWGAWADAGAKHPGWLDYNDHFTFAEAGSPLKAKAEYPLKALAAVDNTCRMSYGFPLLGTEPGACYVDTPTSTPTATTTPTAGKTYKPPTTPLVIPLQILSVEIFDLISGPSSEPTLTGCAYNTSFKGRITVTGAGDVTWRWEESLNGAPYGTGGSPFTKHITGSGTYVLGAASRTSYVTESFKYRIHILTPIEIYSTEITVHITCP